MSVPLKPSSQSSQSAHQQLPPTVGEALKQGFTWDEIYFGSSMDNFGGRAAKFFDMFSVRHLFHSKETISSQKTILGLLHSNKAEFDKLSIKQARRANSVVSATTHPQTGEVIPTVLRMGFQLPYNLLIISAMMSTVGNVPLTMFLHFSNQTYNVFLNYAHRNASNESSNTRLLVSYVGAVGASVSAAVGIVPFVQKLKLNPTVKQVLLRISPLFALSAANLFNISFMRSSELTQGVSLETEDGEFVGRSRKAGVTAIRQTVTCRVLANLPPMILSSLFLSYVTSLRTRPVNPKPISKNVEVGLYLSLMWANYWYSLPGAMSLYPQIAKMKTSTLEPEFQNAVSKKTGKPIEYVYFNKGL